MDYADIRHKISFLNQLSTISPPEFAAEIIEIAPFKGTYEDLKTCSLGDPDQGFFSRKRK